MSGLKLRLNKSKMLAANYLLLILLFPVAALAQSSQVFTVTFKGKDIGTLTYTETRTNETIVRDLRSDTDAKVMVMSIHVESEINSTHAQGELVKSIGYRHANRGPGDIHSQVTKTADGKYTCERNGVKHIESRKINYMVIDFYVREPVGVTEVFSTMHAAFVPLKSLGAGKYVMKTPDNRSSWYSYKNGKLVKIESETPLGNVISTRKQ